MRKLSVMESCVEMSEIEENTSNYVCKNTLMFFYSTVNKKKKHFTSFSEDLIFFGHVFIIIPNFKNERKISFLFI